MTPAAARVMSVAGEMRVFFVLAGFVDRPLANRREHFVGTPEAMVDRFVDYYAAASAGRLQIVPAVGAPVVTLPQPRARYVQRPDAIARDAIAAFLATDAEAAARASLAAAHAVVVFFAGPGAESHLGGAGDPGDPWSNFTPLVPAVRVGDDATVGEACVIAEDETPPLASFGVLCHEFGHLLGLPELYAPGGRPQEGIGVWGLMGQGTWVGKGRRPTGMEAWSRVQLGWVDVETITESTAGVELPAAEEMPRVVKIPAVAGPAGLRREYYLLENRARLGPDAGLPGEGLLVWHVDEAVNGFRSGENDVAHKLLHLVEADGRNDLDRGHAAGGNRGDAGDPWSGPPPWRHGLGGLLAFVGALAAAGAVLRLVRPRALVPVGVLAGVAALALGGAFLLRRGPVCGPGTPGMAPYDGSPVRVVIRNISPPGRRMRFDVLVAPASAED